MENRNKQSEWWDDLGGFFGRSYILGDDSVSGYLPGKQESLEERTQREVDGVVKLLGLEKEWRILDCPCGYGRHAKELVNRGFEVDGVDINEENLRKAGGKNTFYSRSFGGQHIEPVKGTAYFTQFDMRDLRIPLLRNTFDALINMFYSFGFFAKEEENRATLEGFSNVLKEDGQLLIHTDVSPGMVLRGGHYKMEETRKLTDGRELHIKERFVRDTCRMEGTWTIRGPDGKEETLTPYSVRIYGAAEYEMMCKYHGFKEIDIFGSFQGETFDSETSKEMIVVAKK